MANIFARSPYIIEVDESNVIGSQLDLTFYYPGTSPGTAQYVLKKKIPSSNNLKMYYDIAPYCREYLKFTTRQSIIGTLPSTSGIVASNNNQYVLLRVQRYKENTNGTFTLLDTTTNYCFDGYGYYSEGSNPTNSDFIFSGTKYATLKQGTYHYKIGANPTSTESDRAGILGVYNASTLDSVKYTDLVTGGTTTFTTPFALGQTIYDVPTVWAGYYANGNKLEIWQQISTFPVLLGTWIFKPKCEPKYTPINIDFVNKFGYWQREFFFKASKNEISFESKDYNLMQTNSLSYSTLEGQRSAFNHNGQEKITVNTGWVDESFSSTIQEIMLSEKILIDSLPVTVDTKSLDKIKGVNAESPINYTLTFNYAFDAINSVI
tara:strand:+ start:1557 stop:2687 length:1131 start_codon:yes stop_codon:yes gene_type:complete